MRRDYQAMVINVDNNMARMLYYKGFSVFDAMIFVRDEYKERYPDEPNFRITLVEELFT